MAKSNTFTRRSAALAIAGLLFAPAVMAEGTFSEQATEADISGVYFSITPDGGNLPAGSGDAVTGKPLYDAECAACHGFDGEGGIANQLVGGYDSLDGDAPVRTIGSYWPYATTVFDYVRRSMPYATPMSLSNDEYYAITAYLLNMNGIIEGDFVIDRETLPLVQMPNRSGFINAYPERPRQYDFAE